MTDKATTQKPTAAETMRHKIEVLTKQTAKKIADICRRNNVRQDVVTAFTADVTDMLHGTYKGLSATTEQMQTLITQIRPQSWDRTENAALCFIAKYYMDIIQFLHGMSVIGNIYQAATSYIEAAKRLNITAAELINRTTGYNDAAMDARLLDEAHTNYYAYCVLIVGELTDATEEELLTITPPKEIDEMQQRTAVSRALDMQAQRRRIYENIAKKRQETKNRKVKESAAPSLFDGERTIKLYQNITNTLSNNIQTADLMNDDSGRPSMLRPLRQGIEEQRAAAVAVLQDEATDETRKKKAMQLLTTTTAVWQVLDGLQVITQTMQPDASGDTFTRYDMTPHQLTCICTGQDKPNNETIYNCMRGFAWLSTQRMQVWEVGEKCVTLKGADGKALKDESGKPIKKYIQRDICTDFQPLNIDFCKQYENNVFIEDATRVRLHVRNIILNGRSGEYYIDKSSGREERLFIKPPITHVLELRQYYDFQSDEERVFRYIILSKPKQAEDKLLSAVFDYVGRQEQYGRIAAEAKRIATTIANNPTATEEQKQEAEKAAQQAGEKAKYAITNNMGRDVERLKAMFLKARENGLIEWYSRDEAVTTQTKKKYGRGYVWRWQRPTAEQIEKCKKLRDKCKK